MRINRAKKGEREGERLFYTVVSTEIQLSHQSTQVRERKRKKRERGDFSLEMLGYEIGDEFGLLDFTAE